VVQELKADDLVVCQQYRRKGATFSTFGFLAKTWRAEKMPDQKTTSLSTLLAYLNTDEGGAGEQESTVGALLREQLQLFS
jgi:hypothetical protein